MSNFYDVRAPVTDQNDEFSGMGLIINPVSYLEHMFAYEAYWENEYKKGKAKVE